MNFRVSSVFLSEHRKTFCHLLSRRCAGRLITAQTVPLPSFSCLLTRTVVLNSTGAIRLKHLGQIYDPFAQFNVLLFRECVHTKYGKELRSFSVPDTFNRLPDNLFRVDSKGKLKRALQQFF